MIPISILIPNYNGGSFISKVVDAFASGFPGVQIVVVDDMSTDDSIIKLARTEAQVLMREKNGGFAASVNTGLKLLYKEGVKVALIANSDVVVDDLKCAEIRASIPKLSTSSNIAVLGFLENLDEGSAQYQGGNISGFLFALRLDILETVGYFDESFYMYGEEQDYFRRILDAGFKIHQTKICVKHLAEGSGGSKLKNSWLAIRNSLYLEAKRYKLQYFLRKSAVLFLLINRFYLPQAVNDPSLKRVLRPGIILGNIFLLSAICWNGVKITKSFINEKKSKSHKKT